MLKLTEILVLEYKSSITNTTNNFCKVELFSQAKADSTQLG